jgi:SulP family sulfate permease
VGLWSDCGLRIESFHYLNEALEWTENSYLRGMYASSLQAGKQLKQASLGADGALDVPDTKRPPAFVLDEAFENSPRRHHLHEAAKTAVKRGERSAPARPEKGCEERDHSHHRRSNGGGLHRRASTQGSGQEQPYPLLLVTFGAYASAEQDECFFDRLAKYFERVELLRGELVWKVGDEPDAMYLIERGALKARYDFEQEAFDLNEAMLAGTIAGELSFLSRQARNTTTRAELNSVLWKLDLKSLKRLEREAPESFSLFVALLLRVTGDEQENLMNYLVSRLS